MGLFSKRNIDKAKALAEKNKDKIASTVSKATDFVDDKTGGRHTDKLKKVDDAAAKFAGTGETGEESTEPTEPTGSDGSNDTAGTRDDG